MSALAKSAESQKAEREEGLAFARRWRAMRDPIFINGEPYRFIPKTRAA